LAQCRGQLAQAELDARLAADAVDIILPGRSRSVAGVTR